MTLHAALACVGVVGLIAGGVRTWTVPCLAVVALASGAVAVFHRQARLAPVHWLLVAAAGWQTLLVVPVPPTLAALLSPTYAETRTFVWEMLAAPPHWAPLAVNPALCALDAVRLWVALLLVLTVAERAQHSQRLKWVWLSIVAAGVAQLCVGGAFINPNHQAAYWNMAWIAALCATFFARENWLRALLAMASAALLVGVATTGSRAGVAAGALGGMVLFWRLRRELGRRVGVIAFFVALAGIIGVGLAGERVSREMRLHAVEKTRVWHVALAAARQFPVGTGRGAFALVKPGMSPEDEPRPERERGRWDYVENEYLQTLVDYGPYAGAVGLLGFCWVLRELMRRSRWRVETAGVTAVVVTLGAHALFDFNWELAGVFLPVWLLLAALSRPGNHALAPHAFGGSPRTAQWVFGVAAICIPALTAYGVKYEPERLSAEQLVRTRPLDSWAHATLATEAMRAGQGDEALRWLNRAVLVDHEWKQPHIALARLLCASGKRGQARLELAFAEGKSGDEGRDPAVIPLLLQCIDAPGDELDIGAQALPAVIAALVAAKRDASLSAIATRYDGDDPAVFRSLAPWARGRPEWQALLDKWPASDDIGKQRELAEQSGDLAAFAEVYARDPSTGARYVDLLIHAGRLDEAARVNITLEARTQQLNRARIAARRGHAQEAIDAYRLWLSRAPTDSAAATEAALYAERMGDQAAAEALRDMVTRHKDQPHNDQ